MTVLLDIFEPEQIEFLIAQSVPVLRTQLNQHGKADYVFQACDGHWIQIERKQTGELIGGMDKVEEQLQRELQNGIEETILLIEGVAEPTIVENSRPAIQTWRKSSNGRTMVPAHLFKSNYSGYKAWQNQLDKAGVTIVETFDYMATAMTIASLYNNAQKEEHRTLRRYIKNRIYVESPNPHVITLMGVKGGGIGEEKAKALIERYGTAWYVLQGDVDDMATTMVGEKQIGRKAIEKLFKAIGRIR